MVANRPLPSSAWLSLFKPNLTSSLPPTPPSRNIRLQVSGEAAP